MSYRVSVNHAHVFPASINPNGTIDRLRRLMDDCGIEECICFAPFPYQIKDKGIAYEKINFKEPISAAARAAAGKSAPTSSAKPAQQQPPPAAKPKP